MSTRTPVIALLGVCLVTAGASQAQLPDPESVDRRNTETLIRACVAVKEDGPLSLWPMGSRKEVMVRRCLG
jgi:hypothetical protein